MSTDDGRFPHVFPYLLAEIGVNHDGSPSGAAEMIRRSAAAGFDAVKFQYWILDELLARDAPAADYQNAKSQEQLLSDLALSLGDLRALRELTRQQGLDFIITPDGARAFDDVMTLDPDVIKIGSGDADNPHLLQRAAAAAKPVVVSTGMMTESELEQLLHRVARIDDLIILHCVSAYPTPISEAGLSRISVLRSRVGNRVGFSDHTIGVAAPAAAIALGATVIEKHVTWDTSAEGPDHAASLCLTDARDWTEQVRDVAVAVSERRSSAAELSNRRVVRKALYAARSLKAGDVLGGNDVVPLRPLGDGIPAGRLDDVIGAKVVVDVAAGEQLTWIHIGS
jgi:sialic acid synthase SpsE